MGFALNTITILLVLLLVLLIVPITVAFRIDRIKETKGQVIFQWLFGLVRFRISIPDGTKAAPQHKKIPREKTGNRKTSGKVYGVLALLKQPSFRRRLIRSIRGLLRATHARGLYLRLRIGLGDPAGTGRLWGLLGPVAGIASNFHCIKFYIEPDFMTPVLEFESHGEFRLIPLQFIGLATAFMASPVTLKAWVTLFRRNL